MDAALRQAISRTPQATSPGIPAQPGQPGGQVQLFASLTPSWTQTLLQTITAIPVTSTLSATPATPVITPSGLPAETATQFAPTTPELTAQGQELDFRSPYFYCGVLLLANPDLPFQEQVKPALSWLNTSQRLSKANNFVINCKYLNTVPMGDAAI
ncbi:MAG: hypothetical protein ABIU06_07930 [Anaerolineales bacterium]